MKQEKYVLIKKEEGDTGNNYSPSSAIKERSISIHSFRACVVGKLRDAGGRDVGNGPVLFGAVQDFHHLDDGLLGCVSSEILPDEHQFFYIHGCFV